MRTAPTENVKLTLEQLQQIDVVQTRLSVLESEITTAQKILKGTKSECERATKERLYQEELINGLKEPLEQLEAKKLELLEEIQIQIGILDKARVESKLLSEDSYTRSAELKEREEKWYEYERGYHAKVDDFNKKLSELEDDKLKLTKAKEAFTEAASLVVW